jgi:hypothetical protein
VQKRKGSPLTASDIELEEELSADDSEDGEDDNNEGWVDEREAMTEMELKELDNQVRPIRLLLTKVRP